MLDFSNFSILNSSKTLDFEHSLKLEKINYSSKFSPTKQNSIIKNSRFLSKNFCNLHYHIMDFFYAIVLTLLLSVPLDFGCQVGAVLAAWVDVYLGQPRKISVRT